MSIATKSRRALLSLTGLAGVAVPIAAAAAASMPDAKIRTGGPGMYVNPGTGHLVRWSADDVRKFGNLTAGPGHVENIEDMTTAQWLEILEYVEKERGREAEAFRFLSDIIHTDPRAVSDEDTSRVWGIRTGEMTSAEARRERKAETTPSEVSVTCENY